MTTTPLINCLFLDLETTGLEPTQHHILELSILPAQFYGQKFSCYQEKMFTAIINFPIEKLQHNCHQKAFEMHQQNGLIADIVNPNIDKWELKELETELIKRVNFLFGDHSMGIQLAGNSVHFDLAFIKHHMPTFAKRLSYRILDMTTFRTIYSSLYPDDSEQPNPKHRARDDVLYSYGLMLEFIQKLNPTETCRSLN